MSSVRYGEYALLLCGLPAHTTRARHLSISVTYVASALLTLQHHVCSLFASYGFSCQHGSCAECVRQQPLLSAPLLLLLPAHTDVCACMALANSACSCQMSWPVSTSMQSISFWIKHPSTQIADPPKVSKADDDSSWETLVRSGGVIYPTHSVSVWSWLGPGELVDVIDNALDSVRKSTIGFLFCQNSVLMP